MHFVPPPPHHITPSSHPRTHPTLPPCTSHTHPHTHTPALRPVPPHPTPHAHPSYKDYVTTPSGLQYSDLRLGGGAEPAAGDTVVIDWWGLG